MPFYSTVQLSAIRARSSTVFPVLKRRGYVAHLTKTPLTQGGCTSSPFTLSWAVRRCRGGPRFPLVRKATMSQVTQTAKRIIANIETVIVGKRRARSFSRWLLSSAKGICCSKTCRGVAKTILAQSPLGEHRLPVQTRPVYARPASDRRHRNIRLQPEDERVRIPRGADLREYRPCRRGQPGHAANAVVASGGDGRVERLRRRHDLSAAATVLRHRHPKPGRPRGDVRAAGGPVGPLLHEVRPRLPEHGGRNQASGDVARRTPDYTPRRRGDDGGDSRLPQGGSRGSRG